MCNPFSPTPDRGRPMSSPCFYWPNIMGEVRVVPPPKFPRERHGRSPAVPGRKACVLLCLYNVDQRIKGPEKSQVGRVK